MAFLEERRHFYDGKCDAMILSDQSISMLHSGSMNSHDCAALKVTTAEGSNRRRPGGTKGNAGAAGGGAAASRGGTIVQFSPKGSSLSVGACQLDEQGRELATAGLDSKMFKWTS